MRFAKMIPLNSLSVKVLLAYVASAALTILSVLLAANVIMNSQGHILYGADVAHTAQGIAADLQFNNEGVPVGFDAEMANFEWIFENMKQETAYRVLDASGNVVLSSVAGDAFWPGNGADHRLEHGTFEFEREGVLMLGATERVEHKGLVWFVQFVVSARFLELSFRAFALPFAQAGIILFSLVLLFVFGACTYYVMLRYALKPLREISDSAAAISSRSIQARLKTEAVPAEIAPLVDSFNRVLERLERGYRVQQEFLGNAAHELKTPLALIRAQIELRDVGESDRDALLSDVEYMTRQVQQLLLLAEASEVHNYNFTVVRVQEIADEVVSYLWRMAEAADVRLSVSAAVGDVEWRADRGALFTLLKNLLENAIQHAPKQTVVSVEIQSDTVTVRDLGPGVDVAQLPLLFERFWRAKHRRDHGAGLGLAICQEIALAHGWCLTAERAEPGLRFRLSSGGWSDRPDRQGLTGPWPQTPSRAAAGSRCRAFLRRCRARGASRSAT